MGIWRNWKTQTRYSRNIPITRKGYFRNKSNIEIKVYSIDRPAEDFSREKWTFDAYLVWNEKARALVVQGNVGSTERFWVFPAEAIKAADQWLKYFPGVDEEDVEDEEDNFDDDTGFEFYDEDGRHLLAVYDEDGQTWVDIDFDEDPFPSFDEHYPEIDEPPEVYEFSEEESKILRNWTTRTRFLRRAKSNIEIEVFSVGDTVEEWTFDVPDPLWDEDSVPLVFHGKVDSTERFWDFPAEAINAAEQWLKDVVGEEENDVIDFDGHSP